MGKPIEIRVRIAYSDGVWHIEDDHNTINFTTRHVDDALVEMEKIFQKIIDLGYEQVVAEMNLRETPVSRTPDGSTEHQEEQV